MQFPPDPSDGMVFEATPGVFYQYGSVTKSWYRINTPSIPMASQFNDGLMPSEDFLKLTGLLIPPPQINLSFEGCDASYDRGALLLRGDDEGIVIIDVKEENLHENTGVVNIRLDAQKLVQKLLDLGQLRLTSPQGPQGPKGEPGENGPNALPVGPPGPDGRDGSNTPWPGTLSEETFDVAQQNRAIVDITTRRVNPEDNYIVVRRANIGNPEACPDTVIPQDIQSPWVLGFSTGPGGVVFTKLVSPVTGEVCGWACHSDLYYFDVETLIQGIETQFSEWMTKVKTEKEETAEQWLYAMMLEYNHVKSALCCALEACRSRSRNEKTRQYIESQRIQAAQANFQILVGADEDKHYPPLDDKGQCTWNIAPPNYNLLHLSDPYCYIDWTELCPPGSPGQWPMAANPVSAMSAKSAKDPAASEIPTAWVQIESSNVEVQIGASGKYGGGNKIESESMTQWVWMHNQWTLTIWFCKEDHKYASRLFEHKHGEWGFGVDQNVTACFQAGELIDIPGVGKDVAFTIKGSDGLSASRAIVELR